MGFPGGSDGKRILLQYRRPGLDRWAGKIPGRRKWQPLQCSCLENPTDRATWWVAVHGITKSRTRLSSRLPTGTHSRVAGRINQEEHTQTALQKIDDQQGPTARELYSALCDSYMRKESKTMNICVCITITAVRLKTNTL